ncbi:putative phosphotransacetylase [Caldalkalibacillus uzonensis]|uniref:Phosphate propanoyltransferase n=1 Tax=Caldalkalibacillus uzonensis TaxID=353224 RepID=A0ABU0CTU5_9BACI|nr:phosphate propanoyltransferase [Caldalkalibacillus uzonensis]MDQ0339764.1 putative phosphotransacetylase [Caldalkalibacillus uzonensis]
MENKIPVGISNRHVHLSPEHLEQLFGQGYELTELKPLSQPGQFAAKETVTLVGPKGEIPKVRILGPARGHSQVEISKTDSFKLGIHPPVRDSGDIEGTPGIKIIGPKGEVELDKGVIIASRHIHFHTSDAEKFGVKDGDRVRIRTSGERAVIFENVLCRVSDNYALDCHLDTDEGNAAGLKTGDFVELIRD